MKDKIIWRSWACTFFLFLCLFLNDVITIVFLSQIHLIFLRREKFKFDLFLESHGVIWHLRRHAVEEYRRRWRTLTFIATARWILLIARIRLKGELELRLFLGIWTRPLFSWVIRTFFVTIIKGEGFWKVYILFFFFPNIIDRRWPETNCPIPALDAHWKLIWRDWSALHSLEVRARMSCVSN